MKRKRLKNQNTDEAKDTPKHGEQMDRVWHENQLGIDKDKLDEVVSQHPQLFHHVAEGYAYAVSRRDEAKDNIKQAEAEAEAELRDIGDHSKKPTEAAIKTGVSVHKLVTRAKRAYMATSLEADLWLALKDSFHSRRYMISDLVSLHLGGYWSNASAGKAGHDMKEREYQEARQRMREARRKANG